MRERRDTDVLRRNVASARRVISTDGPRQLLTEGLILIESRLGGVPVVDEYCYSRSLAELRDRMDAEEGLEDVIETVERYRGYGRYRSLEPMQIDEELMEFVELVDEREPERIVEIGTAKGGLFYIFCRHLDSAQSIVSLDLPGGPFGGVYSEGRVPLFREFSSRTDLHFVRGDSHDEDTARRLEDRLSGAQVDLLFLDGDHTYDGVRQDFERYKDVVAPDGLIALHDIVPNPSHSDCEVDRFWNELQDEYETRDIVADPEQGWGGIGLVFL